ncbi:MAG: class I SAM-dependent methyltransferase [Candidatus Marinimicrobia bacterium]|nr:class I SAM-dependent methyltransferase [Candidatus Neomarinimicrobiota bacterium]
MNTHRSYPGKDMEAMSFAINYHQWILEEFAPYLGDCIAEVGAGQGNFSEFLLGTNIKQLVAFEPADNMIQLLRQRLGSSARAEVIHAFFEEKSDQFIERFDSICYVNVLEHIEDDRSALIHAFRAIVPGGHILIFVPALPVLYSNQDKILGHFRRYTRPCLSTIVKSAGFNIKHLRYFDIAGILPWFIAFVLLKKSSNAANVMLYDRLVVPIMKKIETKISPFIGKNLILVAQKP